MHDPRTLLVRALLLDAFGQLLTLGLIIWLPSALGLAIGGSSLEGQAGWLLFSRFQIFCQDSPTKACLKAETASQ